ncbi:MAG: SAM-dependent methyltransferase [Clostridiales bacterium]|nr:SAM-dependent methyltransferase [Clostridiales bacterium]
MAGSCGNFADIGCDHGRLGAHMLLAGLCRRAQLTEVSDLSLGKARELFGALGLEGRARFLVGDGAGALEEPPDVAVIAGMGGRTIAGIVERGRETLARARLVMQPNVAAPELRMRLQRAGFKIVDEMIARDGRRLYVVIAAVAGRMELAPAEIEVGPVLLQRRPGALADYAAFRIRVLKKALSGVEDAELRRKMGIWEAVCGGHR